ncbi:MAG: hypothetical protein NXI10_05465 [bacterium]|nr:hypothetical protein [bacterium]
MNEFSDIPMQEHRANGSHVQTESYTPEALSRLKNKIQTFFEQGEHKYYSILVDGETVVPRNYDARKFDNYLQFMEPGVRRVEVRMFQGTSPNCNKYLFVLTGSLSGPQNGGDLEARVQNAMNLEKLKLKLEYTEKELERKTKKCKQRKVKIIQLQEDIAELEEIISEEHSEEAKAKREQFNGILQQGFSAVGSLITGKTANDNNLSGTPNQPESTVEIQMEGEDQNKKKLLQLFEDIYNKYGSKSTEDAIAMILVINSDPELKQLFYNEFKKRQKNG